MSTEVNLMHCVTKSVATYGFENASIKTIAREAGTAVSTIYCHYENKEAMFEATFMYLANIFCEFYASDVSHLVGPDQDTSIRNLWDHYLSFFLSKPEEVLFYVRYRHSAYYTEEIRLRVQAYEARYFKATNQIAKLFGFNQELESAAQVLRFFAEALLLYAEQLLLGKATRKHDDLAFRTIYGAIKSLEAALVSK